MSETPNETAEASSSTAADFERTTALVTAEFQIEEALLEHNIPTYYLKQPQETKQAFLGLLKNLEPMNCIAILCRHDQRIVLRIIPKPPTKPSNVLVNWLLFFATIGTTFLTGYLLSGDLIDPLFGGTAFTVAIMAVVGLHEMGHKLTANKNRIEATPPYFIPGTPPIGGFLGIGTFGAVIMQKSLPPNKDALFDIGSSGPVLSFILSIVATAIGLLYSPIHFTSEQLEGIPVPLLFWWIAEALVPIPQHPPSTYVYIRLHPVAFAGWAGMVVTMFQLFPAAMLDGGHVSRSLFGERTRAVLAVLSAIALIFVNPLMAIFVLFISMYKHPGPLDDVSSLSMSRKLLAIVLVLIFVLSSFLHYFVFALLNLLRV